LTPEEDLFTSVSKVQKVEFEAATCPLLLAMVCIFVGIAEVVGSTPTRSIFVNLVKYGIERSTF
jgi:hypothetical protein